MSYDQLYKNIPINQSVNYNALNFEDKQKCVERVCQDIFSNIEEFNEIKSSLSELASILEEQGDRL